MSAEWITAIGTIGTFVVIAASAVAALMQLRHMRGSNQLLALNEVMKTVSTEKFQASLHAAQEIHKQFGDPNVRAGLLSREFVTDFHDLAVLVNFYDQLGGLVKRGAIDRAIACDSWTIPILEYWRLLSPIVANRRKALAIPGLYENFEYLAALCRQWIDEHPEGTYPASLPRMPLPNLWPEAAVSENDRVG